MAARPHRRGLPAVARVCGLIGTAPLVTEATFDMNIILFGGTITGVVEGDSVAEVFIQSLIKLYRQGRIPFDR